jgi:N-acetylmuramic acid 6-phosphate etherase
MSQPGAGTNTSLDELVTEARNPAAGDLDLKTTEELVALMGAEDATVPAAVAQAHPAIAAAIDEIAARLRAGGRLVYVGAGTSGRLAALDAAECESTFSTARGQVVALLAGGHGSSPVEQEAAEDDEAGGAEAVRELHVGPDDAVVGVSASGRTPYVLGALTASREAGAATVALVSVRGSEAGRTADHEIVVVVGPEILAGSTRLKSGTAQKLVLNMLSTISMVRLGKTYGNLMVDVLASNEKLHARVRRVVAEAAGVTPELAGEALEAAQGDARVAIVALLASVDAETARQRLDAANGSIRAAAGT